MKSPDDADGTTLVMANDSFYTESTVVRMVEVGDLLF